MFVYCKFIGGNFFVKKVVAVVKAEKICEKVVTVEVNDVFLGFGVIEFQNDVPAKGITDKFS